MRTFVGGEGGAVGTFFGAFIDDTQAIFLAAGVSDGFKREVMINEGVGCPPGQNLRCQCGSAGCVFQRDMNLFPNAEIAAVDDNVELVQIVLLRDKSLCDCFAGSEFSASIFS